MFNLCYRQLRATPKGVVMFQEFELNRKDKDELSHSSVLKALVLEPHAPTVTLPSKLPLSSKETPNAWPEK